MSLLSKSLQSNILAGQDRVSPRAAAPGAAVLLAWSDVRDAEQAARLAATREAYHAGLAAGLERGHRETLENLAAAERRALGGLVRLADRPDVAEMERRRWSLRGEPRTRETFADPHPGDRGPFGAAEITAIRATWAGVR